MAEPVGATTQAGPDSGRGAPGPAGRHALIVALAALISHAWVLVLPFQLDDYGQIPAAAAYLGLRPPPVWNPVAASEDAPQGTAAPGYLFRPVLWLFWSGLLGLSGPPLSPLLFHAASLALHGLCAMVVYGFLRRILAPGGALLGALFFAVHPAASEGVAWISAGGDLLLTLFGVSAALVLMGGSPSWPRLFGSGTLLGMGLLSKEAGLPLVPLLAAIVLVRRDAASPGLRLLRLCGFLLPATLAWFWRCFTLGTFSLTYASGTSVTWDAIPRMAAKIPDHLRFFGAPWLLGDRENAPPFIDAVLESVLGPLTWSAAAATLLLWPVAGFLSSPMGCLRRIVPALVVWSALCVPPLFAAPGAAGAVFSRSLYLPMAALAWAVGAASPRGRLRRPVLARRALAVVLMVQVLMSVDAHIHIARVWLQAGSRARKEIAAIEAAIASDNREVDIVMVDSWAAHEILPGVGSLVGLAFQPPFRRERQNVFFFASQGELQQHPLLSTRDPPIQVLERTGRESIAVRATLPPLPEGEIALLPADTHELRHVWKPSFDLPPRGVRSVGLRIPPRPEGRVGLRLVSEASSLDLASVLPASGGETVLTVVLDPDLSWLLSRRLVEVVLEGSGLEGLPPPELRRDVPELELLKPRPGAVLILGTVPEIEIAKAPPASHLRFRFEVDMEGRWFEAMSYDPGTSRLRVLPDGGVEWIPGPADAVTSTLNDALRWETVPAFFDAHLAPRGIRTVRWRLRAEARTADGGFLSARSTWVHFSLRH